MKHFKIFMIALLIITTGSVFGQNVVFEPLTPQLKMSQSEGDDYVAIMNTGDVTFTVAHSTFWNADSTLPVVMLLEENFEITGVWYTSDKLFHFILNSLIPTGDSLVFKFITPTEDSLACRNIQVFAREGDTTTNSEFMSTGNEFFFRSVGTTTATEEAKEFYDLIIYPNPVNSFLNVSYAETIKEIHIYNISGKNVWSGIATRIDVSPFLPGLYFMRVQTKSGVVVTSKFLKQ